MECERLAGEAFGLAEASPQEGHGRLGPRRPQHFVGLSGLAGLAGIAFDVVFEARCVTGGESDTRRSGDQCGRHVRGDFGAVEQSQFGRDIELLGADLLRRRA